MKIINHLLHDAACKAMPFHPTPNQGGQVTHRYLVMHYTEGSTAAGALSHMAKASTQAAAHLVIARNGDITQMVRFDRVAWHAGSSSWAGLSGMNQYSLGIELDNAGEMKRVNGKWVSPFNKVYPDGEVLEAQHKNKNHTSGWHIYTEQQMEVAAEVAALLVEHYGLRDVIGHDDIAPTRKRDPGPAFPMNSFRERTLGGVLGGGPEADPDYFVVTGNLNLREGPGTGYTKVIAGTLPPGTRVRRLARQQVWWQVDVEDTVEGEMDLQGWVHSGYLREVSSIPVIVLAPAAALPAAPTPSFAPAAPVPTIVVPIASYSVPDESDEVLRYVSFAEVVSIGANYRAKFANADAGYAKKDPSRCKAILRFPDGTIFFDAKMALCVDGSPRAKQLDKDGLLGTAHSIGGKAINAEEVPYVVLPMRDKNTGENFAADMGLKKGDLAMVIYRGQKCPAVFGELGPVDKIGETSIRVHELLDEVPSPWTNHKKEAIRNVSVRESVLYLIFPGTAKLLNGITPANAESMIKTAANQCFAEFEART